MKIQELRISQKFLYKNQLYEITGLTTIPNPAVTAVHVESQQIMTLSPDGIQPMPEQPYLNIDSFNNLSLCLQVGNYIYTADVDTDADYKAMYLGISEKDNMENHADLLRMRSTKDQNMTELHAWTRAPEAMPEYVGTISIPDYLIYKNEEENNS